MKDALIKRMPTVFLQAVIILIGIGALAFLLGEPLIEGRNAHATLFEVYFNDWFLAWAYTASIAFFVALYKAFTLLGSVARNEVFSLRSVKALRTIQYCGLILVAFLVWAEAYLFIVRPEEDIAGGVAMGLMIIFLSSVVIAIAAMLEKLVQSVVDMTRTVS